MVSICGLFPSRSQCSQYRLWVHCSPEQETFLIVPKWCNRKALMMPQLSVAKSPREQNRSCSLDGRDDIQYTLLPTRESLAHCGHLWAHVYRKKATRCMWEEKKIKNSWNVGHSFYCSFTVEVTTNTTGCQLQAFILHTSFSSSMNL